ncbi:BMP family lipoprotein [Cryptosporangium phraense]|uniref:BMP family ABC transporter substrate-binding protein n=1 Tax=Cryptosporangium phraense TaxID=2593070 RepID=A0A545AQ14_9ACTN|nr:BMP family ABC transporter substrate-binding protein [Cryptosporangium phraense]TQS43419.1 BMP family ABC transporter substrate-binding protein [Cryptosporangium phraense]
MRPLNLTAVVVGLALVAAACTSPGDTTTATAETKAASAGPNGGTIPAGEPDINGDGKVVIGVLSPGDINDNGYYESFVAKAEVFTKSQGWTLIKVGSVNPAEAVNQARQLCRQKADLIAMNGELKDGATAATESVCAKTAWFIPGSSDIKQTPQIALSRDFVAESIYTAGYANGLLMKQKGYTKAGYISGPELDFSVQAAKAFRAGIRAVLPDATVAATYTGDFNDSAKAKEAAQAQIAQGIKTIYPYLGGATDAVAALGNQNDVILSTPGTDRCTGTPKFDVSVIFDPGEYLAAALKDFADGKLAMGVAREWHIGKDPVPTVKLCNAPDELNRQLESTIADIAAGKLDVDAQVAKLGS